MNKKDLKKLALLGIASGTVLATQVVEANPADHAVDSSQTLVRGGCGSSCGGGTQAYRSTQQNTYYYDNASNGCQASTQQPHGTTQPTQPTQPTSGCGGSSGCGSKGSTPGQTAYYQNGSYYYYQQPQHGCGGQQSYNQNSNMQPSQMWQSTQPAQPQTSTPNQPQTTTVTPTTPTTPSATSTPSQGNSAYRQRYSQQPSNR